MSDTADLNARWASALIDGLVRAGVRRFVISPGSRSTPLVMAVAHHPETSDHVVIDERGAAFFALGQSLADGAPTGLICTSGTAVANWTPAVWEADAAKVPLVLLSADRPPEDVDVGANQTTDQIKAFGDHVRAFHALPPPDEGSLGTLHHLAARMVDGSVCPCPGPVHLNVPFREPLLPEGAWPTAKAGPAIAVHRPLPIPEAATVMELAGRMAHGRGLIVAGWDRYGPDFARSVARLARTLRVPLLADPLSGLRRGAFVNEAVFGRHDRFLGEGDFARDHAPDWVLRFGAFPVSKTLERFLAAARADCIAVTAFGRWSDPLHGLSTLVHADPTAVAEGLAHAVAAPAPPGWLEAWQAAENGAAGDDGAEARLIAAFTDALPPGAVLFAGNSLPVRLLDRHLGCGTKPLSIVGNRGLSGIDGAVSTVLGVAHALEGRAPVAALLGDLTFAHDLAGLLAGGGGTAVIVVLDNGGGGIFRRLPQAGLDPALFERYWLTPRPYAMTAAAAALGVQAQDVAKVEDFAAAFKAALARGGVSVIRVAIPGSTSVQVKSPERR